MMKNCQSILSINQSSLLKHFSSFSGDDTVSVFPLSFFLSLSLTLLGMTDKAAWVYSRRLTAAPQVGGSALGDAVYANLR